MNFAHQHYSNHSINSKIQNHTPSPLNIKALIQISNSDVDINMTKKIKMSTKVNEIMDIDWHISQIDYEISIGRDLLWLSGTLNAEITYTKNTFSKVYLNTIKIPWKKTSHLSYIYPPILPSQNDKSKYDFVDEVKSVTHYEQTINFNEKPKLDIISAKIISTNQIIHSDLIIDVNCKIHYQIYQNQIINM